MKPAKFAEGIIAQEFTPDQVVDDSSMVLAFLKLFKTGQVGLMWSPFLFNNPAMPLPDELRAELVEILRYHADKLESREMDKRMQEIRGNMTGAA